MSGLALNLGTLKMKNREELNGTGVRRYFVVKGYEEVAQFFHIYRRTKATKPSLYTGDFDTMYTTIDHADLLFRIRECVEEAFSYKAFVEGISGDDMQLL